MTTLIDTYTKFKVWLVTKSFTADYYFTLSSYLEPLTITDKKLSFWEKFVCRLSGRPVDQTFHNLYHVHPKLTKNLADSCSRMIVVSNGKLIYPSCRSYIEESGKAEKEYILKDLVNLRTAYIIIGEGQEMDECIDVTESVRYALRANDGVFCTMLLFPWLLEVNRIRIGEHHKTVCLELSQKEDIPFSKSKITNQKIVL